jgi:hypothetical protein
MFSRLLFVLLYFFDWPLCCLSFLDFLRILAISFLEEFEDTKWLIRIRNSKKDRQHNDQNKKDKRTNNNIGVLKNAKQFLIH